MFVKFSCTRKIAYYLSKINHLLMSIMVYVKSRAALQILLQGIILKPLKMLMAKLYLLQGWSRGGAAHPLFGRGWGKEMLIIKKLINH